MATTPRMEQLKALLADDPGDAFLRYGIAMEHASIGDDAAAVAALRELMTITIEQPYVPAYLQAGQALMRLGRNDEAVETLRVGVEVAKAAGEMHAASEMLGLLSTLE